MASSKPRHFASDTYAPICPQAWAAMEAVNRDHAVAYGDDQHTAKSVAAVRAFLDAPTCEVFFVSSGTVGNALALASMVQPFQSVGSLLIRPPAIPDVFLCDFLKRIVSPPRRPTSLQDTTC